MATELRHRRDHADHTHAENDIIADHTHAENDIKDEHTHSDNDDDYYDDDDGVEEITRGGRWKAAIARRGLWTLMLAVAVPVSLHCIEIFCLRSPEMVASKPSWYPSMMVDLITVHVSLVISISFWFGWAERGEIRRPKNVAVVFILYLSLTLAWDRIVFEHGALKFGMLVSFGRYLLGEELSNLLKELNETAGKIVMTSIFLWTYFSASMGVKLIFW
ncbi:hypothetical protein Vadar_001233 [Vaccinium darrowii]|uniref:Uncharacterized protein n=1 Tax=Vaccinium darrowii TaxID=229202 RepID=A0ACB7XVZ8_9ERIC|nr:hypothetical protein Vadar_001233 [Vaccinium darrowii]